MKKLLLSTMCLLGFATSALATDTYELVTDASQIVANDGSEYIIVNSKANGANLAMAKATSSPGSCGNVTVDVLSSHITITTPDASLAVFHIVDGTEDKKYSLQYADDNMFLAMTGKSTGFKAVASKGTTSSGYTDLTISLLKEGNIDITYPSASSRKITYYSTNSDFRCYTSIATGQEVYLYKKSNRYT